MENENYYFPEISKNEKFVLFDKLNNDQNSNMNFEQYSKKIYNI